MTHRKAAGRLTLFDTEKRRHPITITPYDWQQRDITTLRANDYTGLLNVQPGGGKTVTATGAVLDSGASTVLVVGPDGTLGTAWKPTFEKMGGPEVRRIGNGKKADKVAMSDFKVGIPGVYFASPQFLTRTAEPLDWMGDMLIVDEGHMLNAAKSKGQRVLSGFHPSDGQPMSSRFGSRLFLSGSPARNNFERMWATSRFLWPHLYERGQVAYDNYYMWLADRMDYTDIVTGFEWAEVTQPWHTEGNRTKRIDGVLHYGKETKVKKWLAETEPGRLLSEMPCVIQHFRRERCCDAHPEGFLKTDAPNVVHRTVPLLPKQRKAIDDLESQYLAWLDDNPLVVDLALTQKQRIRQICLGVPHVESVHVDGEIKSKVTFPNADQSPFADELETVLEQIAPEPLVVFLDSQQFATALVKRLNDKGITSFEYSGATTKTRDADLAGFGTTYRVAVITLAAGGTGIDSLQKIALNEVWLGESVDDTLNEQGRARTDRMGARGQIQRFMFHDDMDYSYGAMSARLVKRIELNKSLRVAA